MDYFVVLTLTCPDQAVYTATRVITASSGATVGAVYEHVRAEITAAHPEFRNASVSCFGVWPNQLA